MPHLHGEPIRLGMKPRIQCQHDPDETSITFSSLITYTSTEICLSVKESEK